MHAKSDKLSAIGFPPSEELDTAPAAIKAASPAERLYLGHQDCMDDILSHGLQILVWHVRRPNPNVIYLALHLSTQTIRADFREGDEDSNFSI